MAVLAQFGGGIVLGGWRRNANNRIPNSPRNQISFVPWNPPSGGESQGSHPTIQFQAPVLRVPHWFSNFI